MINGEPLFPTFADAIRNLPAGRLGDNDLLPFRLHDGLGIQIYFAPFEWMNESARVVIVGITPGRASMECSLSASRAALIERRGIEEASKRGKLTGSFSNMRDVLAYRLDAIGLHHALGISSTVEFWTCRPDLLHPTSCVRYPVFAWDKKKEKWVNYGGYKPRTPAHHPVLREYVAVSLAAELRRLPNALVVPLGSAVSEALRAIGAKEDRCLYGFPHASNGKGARERAENFDLMKGSLAAKVKTWSRNYDK